MIKKIRVHLASRSYDIFVGENAVDHLSSYIRKTALGSTAVLVTTKTIKKIHAQKIVKQLKKADVRALILTIPDSEKSKNAKLALKLIEQLTRFDKGRNIFLIALGGGVVGDLTGFIAAIYKRGIPYIQIPTTLLAQIDSSIGGKTAVDTLIGKNLVGAFYQPRFVVSDCHILRSLPLKQIRAGLAEAVKYGAIKDSKLFSFLEKNISKILTLQSSVIVPMVIRCASIKAKIVSKDEFDRKELRIVLNFGHTLGHAFESVSNFKISHGQGVSLGMVYACKIANRLGLLKTRDTLRLTTLLKNIGLPTENKNFNLKTVLKTMAHDKKFKNGLNRFVLLKKIGVTKVVDNIPRSTIQNALTH
jgi:3-dehydroquinate synthase